MKEKIKNMINWLRSWDDKLWGEQFAGSSWLGVITIIVAAVAGALLTIFEGGLDDSFIPYIVVIALANIVESILSAKNTKVAVLRSLLMTVAVVVAMFAGVVVVVVVALVLLVMFAGFLMSLVGEGGSGSGSSRKRKIKIDGEEVTESSDLLGFDKTYESKESDRKWRSTDGGTTATEE
ncbi:MAG: hypothetical protein IJZ09_00110 [Tidjanibacter sp.]|nr:hypothetical protein [Tidjanibacter sp.]